MKSIYKETTNQIPPGEGTRDDAGEDFNPVSYSLTSTQCGCLQGASQTSDYKRNFNNSFNFYN